MATRGVQMTVQFVAWDTTNNVGKTGDNANFTLRWVKDGTSSAPTNSSSEVDATNCPGVYKITITTTEAACDVGTICGKSSTSGVVIIPTTVTFVQTPNAAPGASGGLPTVDSSNAVKLQSGTGANQISLASGAVTVGTNNDKTGYTASTVSDKTGYSISGTKQTLDALNDITAAAVWGVGTKEITGGTVGSVTNDVGITQAGADKVWGTTARALTDKAGFGLADGTITAAVIAQDAIDADAIKTDAVTEIVDAIFAKVIENSLTFLQLVRRLIGFAYGKSSGGGTSSLKFRDLTDTYDRITATVDANGNRTAMSFNDTP